MTYKLTTELNGNHVVVEYSVQDEIQIDKIWMDGIPVISHRLWDAIIEDIEKEVQEDYIKVYQQYLEDKAVQAIEARLQAEEDN